MEQFAQQAIQTGCLHLHLKAKTTLEQRYGDLLQVVAKMLASTQRCILHYFTLFYTQGLGYSRDVKKVELHVKDWLSQKCAEEARNIVNYSVAWPRRNTPSCMRVAYVLRMCCV